MMIPVAAVLVVSTLAEYPLALELKPGQGTFRTSGGNTYTLNAKDKIPEPISQSTVNVTVNCASGAPECADLLARSLWMLNGTASSGATSPLTIQAIDKEMLVNIALVDNKDARNVSNSIVVRIAATGSGLPTNTNPSRMDGKKKLEPPPASMACAEGLTTEFSVPPYDVAKNQAYALVTLNGLVLAGDLSQVDENDTVNLIVIAPQSLAQSLQVRRISPQRAVGAYRIAGGTELPPGIREAGEQEACLAVRARMDSFEPGAAEIEITVESTDQTRRRIGLIEFNVNPLYRGIFSFGGAWSALPDPLFATVQTADGRTLITNRQPGEHRLAYVLLFTPFVWGQRDFEKEGPPIDAKEIAWGSILTHFNPTVGFSVTNPLENAFAGVSLDLFEGILVTGGMHVGHVTVLDPTADLAIGDVFPGAPSAVPTAREWRTNWFWSISIDLRAAVLLLRTILGTASPH